MDGFFKIIELILKKMKVPFLVFIFIMLFCSIGFYFFYQEFKNISLILIIISSSIIIVSVIYYVFHFVWFRFYGYFKINKEIKENIKLLNKDQLNAIMELYDNQSLMLDRQSVDFRVLLNLKLIITAYYTNIYDPLEVECSLQPIVNKYIDKHPWVIKYYNSCVEKETNNNEN